MSSIRGLSGLSGLGTSLASLALEGSYGLDSDPYGYGSTSGRTANDLTGAAALGVGTTSGESTSSAIGKAAFGLSTDEFFSLFLAQLANQDPTQPVDDKEMVAQLAQFTMIQTLNDMAASLKGSKLAESAGMIGKEISGYDETGATVTGVVTKVETTADSYWLIVGDRRVAPESVASVATPATTA